jgi:hypothetical protein
MIDGFLIALNGLSKRWLMKIVKVEDLHCDAGWRVDSFLKVTTDEGIVGWSEYMEGYGAQGLTGVISKLAERHLIDQEPRPIERIYGTALRRHPIGGRSHQGFLRNLDVGFRVLVLLVSARHGLSLR